MWYIYKGIVGFAAMVGLETLVFMKYIFHTKCQSTPIVSILVLNFLKFIKNFIPGIKDSIDSI